MLELDAALSVGGAFEQRFEPGIGHGLVFQVELSECLDLGIGIGHELHLVDKPSIAVGVSILQGDVAIAENHPLHVEHVEHRRHRIGVEGRGHIRIQLLLAADAARGELRTVGRRLGISLLSSFAEVLAFVVEIEIDQLLVATEFRGVIATDRLVPESRLVRSLVERATTGKIQHTVVGIFVLQNELIGGRFGKVALHRFGFFETVGVEVAAIDVDEVAKREDEEHAHHSRRGNGFRPFGISGHQRKGNERKEESAPSRG